MWNEAEALRKGQEQENQRIEERHAEQIEGQKRLERLIEAAASGTASVQALAEIRVLLSQEIPGIKEIPPDQLPGLLKKIIEDLHKPTSRAEDVSDTVKRVLTDAGSQAKQLKFAGAAQVLDAALAQSESEG